MKIVAGSRVVECRHLGSVGLLDLARLIRAEGNLPRYGLEVLLALERPLGHVCLWTWRFFLVCEESCELLWVLLFVLLEEPLMPLLYGNGLVELASLPVVDVSEVTVDIIAVRVHQQRAVADALCLLEGWNVAWPGREVILFS